MDKKALLRLEDRITIKDIVSRDDLFHICCTECYKKINECECIITLKVYISCCYNYPICKHNGYGFRT